MDAHRCHIWTALRIRGLDFMRGVFSDEGAFALPAAGASKLMLLVTGSIYTYICVQSFRHARMSREE